MSKLGFDMDLRRVDAAEKEFFRKAMKLAQKEFKTNFDTESNTEEGTPWDAVLRAYPPPILDVTGELRAQALATGNIRYYPGRAVLRVDPIDPRGRGYAQYHQDGIGRVAERAFITQSESLTNDQESLVIEHVDYILRG